MSNIAWVSGPGGILRLNVQNNLLANITQRIKGTCVVHWNFYAIIINQQKLMNCSEPIDHDLPRQQFVW